MVIKRFSCFISIVPQSLSLAASRHRTTWSLVRCSIVQRRAHCATYWCLPFVFLSWIHTSTLFRLSCLVKTKFFLALFSSVFLRLLFEFALFSLCIVLTCCGRRRASWYILQHAICHGLHLTPPNTPASTRKPYSHSTQPLYVEHSIPLGLALCLHCASAESPLLLLPLPLILVKDSFVRALQALQALLVCCLLLLSEDDNRTEWLACKCPALAVTGLSWAGLSWAETAAA